MAITREDIKKRMEQMLEDCVESMHKSIDRVAEQIGEDVLEKSEDNFIIPKLLLTNILEFESKEYQLPSEMKRKYSKLSKECWLAVLNARY